MSRLSECLNIRCEDFAELRGRVFNHAAQLFNRRGQCAGFHFNTVLHRRLVVHFGNHCVKARQATLPQNAGDTTAFLTKDRIGHVHDTLIAEFCLDFAKLGLQRAGNVTQAFHGAVFVEKLEFRTRGGHHVFDLGLHAFAGFFDQLRTTRQLTEHHRKIRTER